MNRNKLFKDYFNVLENTIYDGNFDGRYTQVDETHCFYVEALNVDTKEVDSFYGDFIDRLGTFENIMERYGIKSFTELLVILSLHKISKENKENKNV